MESWYVSEHAERLGFPSEWIGLTFSYVAIWSGILAILAVGELLYMTSAYRRRGRSNKNPCLRVDSAVQDD